MARRDVKIGLATYRRADAPQDTAIWGFGMLGESVDVHADDVDRFDRLNGPAEPTPPAPLPVTMTRPDEDEPPRAGKGSSLEAWTAYAEGLDLDVPEGASRDEVISLVDASK